MWEEVCMFLFLLSVIGYGLFCIEPPLNLLTLPFAIFFFAVILKKRN
jgi:hypothetical protein